MTEAEWLACQDGWLMAEQREEDERQRKWELLAVACWRRYPPHLRDHPDTQAIIAVNEAAADARPMPDSEWANADCFVLHWLDAQENALGCHWTETTEERRRVVAEQARLMREVFGNPFQRSHFDPGCRTPTVTGLALAAYEQRDPVSGDLDNARLAILSDALEEAGCAEPAILSHLRSPGPHVRGCWAVDLVLGKQ